MNKSIIGWISALLGATSIGIAFVDKENFLWWLLPGLIPYIAFLWGVLTKCPQCGRWWASVHNDSELLDRWQETKDVEREDVTRDQTGRETRTKRIEQIIVNCEKRRHHYSCKYCSAAWTEIKVSRDK